MNNKTARRMRKKLKDKKAQIIVRLLPEASKIANESLKAEIEKEIKKAIWAIPWTDQLESVEIQEANQTM
jgi:hypothetical protein